MNKIYTIGVYGFTTQGFFQSLIGAHIDTFLDIRLRRGMRGTQYSFANATVLVRRLSALGVAYYHVKALAPTREIRSLQTERDHAAGVAKRLRAVLSPEFVTAYRTHCLDPFAFQSFYNMLGASAGNIVFFCVEREPLACHRYLVAERFARLYNLPVEHLKP